MQKDPFIILGIDRESANQNDVETAYRELKRKYTDGMMQDGEAGAEASRKLGEVESAYQDALSELERRNTFDSFGSVLGDVEKAIKNGQLEEAQSKLDMLSVRDAEWHYLQSVIYYKKGWHLESKKQLELAVSMDPDKQKYKVALDKLIAVTEGRPYAPESEKREENAESQRERPSANPYRSYNRRDDAICDVCQGLICADCCCECLGGDLIRCC